MIKKKTIYLIGDAILDNYEYLEDKERDLYNEIKDLGYTVHNFAADHFCVHNLAQGISKIKSSRSYPYLLESDNKIYPLKLLSKMENKNKSFSSVYGSILDKKEINMAVLSIGGNDLKNSSSNIIFGFDYYVNSVISNDFIEKYESIIRNILSSCDRIVLVSIYLPYMGKGSSYSKYIMFTKPIMEKWNAFLEKVAIKYNIPILDLSKTLNIYNRDHYGSSETSTSNISTKCIAKCISYIFENYNGYKIYYAPDCDKNNIITV